MKTLRYIAAGVRHNARLYAGTLVAAATASAVLVGALLVGDSVRGSLRSLVALRLGHSRLALFTDNRFLNRSLAADLESAAGKRVVPFLAVEGVLLTPAGDGPRRSVNGVQVLGVEEGFWDLALAGDAARLHPAAGEMVTDERTAADLGLVPGKDAVLRLEVPSLLPRDALLSARGPADTVSFALRVSGIAGDATHGRFSLEQTQLPPRNVIVPLTWLQQALSTPGAVNGLVTADPGVSAADLREALDRVLDLGHVGMRLKEAGDGRRVLTGDRIFLEAPVARKALALPGASGMLHYLGIEIAAAGEGADPGSAAGPPASAYPFVAAVGPAASREPGPVPAGMGDDEIVVNRWLADALSLSPGGRVKLSYYHLTDANRLEIRSRSFHVHSVLSMEEAVRERDGVPVYPGLSDVDRCRDWEIGMPLDPDRLEDPAIQEYWERYRMTPKAFVTLAAGRSMWANRYGDLTAVTYPADGRRTAELARDLAASLDPEDLGLVFVPVRREALRGVDAAMDFGDLFLGLGFFLVAAALVLAAMLFSFSVLRRLPEMGTLLALGFRRGRVAALVLGEGLTVALAGAAAGAPLGVLYTRAVLAGLSAGWSGAVAGTPLALSVDPRTLVAGAAAAALCSFLAMAVSVLGVLRLPPRMLVDGVLPEGPGAGSGPAGFRLGLGILAAAVAAALFADPAAADSARVFFGAGVLMLVSSLLLLARLLRRLGPVRGRTGLLGLGLRGVSRRRGRSLAVVGLVASSCFLVISVSAMREDRHSLAGGRSSGTGGFALVARTSLPVPADPADPGLVELGLNRRLPAGAALVPLKVGPGDDASCFNLNRVWRPRLLGVDPDLMSQRGAFTEEPGDGVWRLLETALPGGEIPALAGDRDTALWNLRVPAGVKKGHRFLYRDDLGREAVVRLVGTLPPRKTILQGRLVISLAHFTRLYPSVGGWNLILADAPPDALPATRGVLEQALFRYGADLVPAGRYLESYYAVENTYLSVFLLLGGLGVILGTVGLGAVVMRNALERRGELALLAAVGFSPAEVRTVLALEHGVLLAAGVAAGVLSAMVAVRPALAASGGALPWPALGGLVTAVAVVGALSVAAASRMATRAPITESLTRE